MTGQERDERCEDMVFAPLSYGWEPVVFGDGPEVS